MLPRLKQRLVIASGVALGGICWLLARGFLTASDGSVGLSLIDAHNGIAVAVIALLIAGVPAVLASTLSASTGNPLAGAFTLGGSLMVLAAVGGASQGFIHRAELPGDYRRLAIESGVWIVLLIVILLIVDRLRLMVRPRIKPLVSKQHLGARIKLGLPGSQPLLAGAVSAALGALACNLLIQTPDGGQVNCSLVLGFAVAAMIARMLVPQQNPIVILISPLVVGIGVYLWVASSYQSQDALLADYYSRDLFNLAVALPIHYASAGVAGCAIGVGMAQSMEYVRQTTTVTA